MEDKLGLEYEVGRAFLEEIVPFSVEFYLNINPDDGFEDEDEDEDFEDEDDDDDDEDDKKKKKKKVN